PAPRSVVAGSVIEDHEPATPAAPPVVSASELAAHNPAETADGAGATPAESTSEATAGDSPSPDAEDQAARRSEAADTSGAPSSNGGSSGSNGASAPAGRTFDVPTTPRRRPVIFEEDDDLDVPDFLK